MLAHTAIAAHTGSAAHTTIAALHFTVVGWLLFMAGVAGDAGAASAPAAGQRAAQLVPTAEQPPSAAPELRFLQHDGRERSYYLVAPARAEGERLPLVLVLHGGGGNGRNALKMTGFGEKARTARFVAVFPEGSGRLNNMLTWNAIHCCGYAMQQRIDDVGFIARLIDTLVREHVADPVRIYVTGMSNGAMMAHRLGQQLPDRIAAIAPVVGALFGDERVPVPASAAGIVSALMINGALDSSVPPEGGASRGRFPNAWDGHPLAPASAQAAFWARAAGCQAKPMVVTSAAWVLSEYACPRGVRVASYLLAASGHAWPGGVRGGALGDPPSTLMNATDLIWAFFVAHPKSAAGLRD